MSRPTIYTKPTLTGLKDLIEKLSRRVEVLEDKVATLKRHAKT